MSQAQDSQELKSRGDSNEHRPVLIFLSCAVLFYAFVSIISRWQSLRMMNKFASFAFLSFLCICALSEMFSEKSGHKFFRNRLPVLGYILIMIALMTIA